MEAESTQIPWSKKETCDYRRGASLVKVILRSAARSCGSVAVCAKVITRTELEDTTTTAAYAEFGDYMLKYGGDGGHFCGMRREKKWNASADHGKSV